MHRLLKPLEPEKLTAALRKAVTAVRDGEQRTLQAHQSGEKLRELARRQRQTLLDELVRGGNAQPACAELRRADPAIAQATQCMVLVCDLFFWPSRDGHLALRIQEAVARMTDWLEQRNCGAILHRNQLVMLLYGQFADAQRMAVRELESIAPGRGMFWGCSEYLSFPARVSDAFEQARQAFANGAPGSEGLARFESGRVAGHLHMDIQTENQVLSALLIGDTSAIDPAVERWLDLALEGQNLTPGLVKELWMYFDRLYRHWIGYFYDRHPSFSHTDLPGGPDLAPGPDVRGRLGAYFCRALVQVCREIRAARQNSDRMYEVADYLELNYQRPFDQRAYSQLFHINKDYLSRKFKETFGVGMVTYLTDVRIKHAKELLVSSDLQIQQIATEVGFQDEGYFTKQFKKAVSMTPLAYRTWRQGQQES